MEDVIPSSPTLHATLSAQYSILCTGRDTQTVTPPHSAENTLDQHLGKQTAPQPELLSKPSCPEDSMQDIKPLGQDSFCLSKLSG